MIKQNQQEAPKNPDSNFKGRHEKKKNDPKIITFSQMQLAHLNKKSKVKSKNVDRTKMIIY